MKIRNFRHKGLEDFFRTGAVTGVKPTHATRLRGSLSILSNANSVDEFSRVAHQMSKGSKYEGYWAMKISAQWRIIFKVSVGETIYDIDYVNYH